MADLLLFIKWYFGNLNSITLCFLVVTFLLSWGVKIKNGGAALENHVLNASAAATIPTGIALIFCAFNQDLVKDLSGLSINLCIAGLVVFFTSLRASINGIFA